MNGPSLSVIIPTAGRETIERTAHSILRQQIVEEDEFLIVCDGEQPDARIMADELGPQFKYIETEPTGDFGNSQRRHGLEKARGDLIVWMDDDDVFTNDAFAQVRARAQANPGRPLLFKFMLPSGRIVWRERGRLEMGHVGGHEFVTPNIPGRVGEWGGRYEGDFDFIRSTLDLYPDKDDALVWCDEFIAVCRPSVYVTKEGEVL